MPKDSPSKDPNPLDSIPHERKEPRPDFSAPIPRQKLPPTLQKTLESDDGLWDTITSGHAGESTDSSVRYAGYASRLRTIMLSAHRYVAYTSEIGESFRPVAHPFLIKGAYGVSWAYLIGDVGYEGYKAYLSNQSLLHPSPLGEHGSAVAVSGTGSSLGGGGGGGDGGAVRKIAPLEDYRTVMAQRAVFQSIASMGLPAFTIHSIVRYSGRAMKNVKNVKVRTWGPVGLGLAAVPALPFLFDEPVEKATEWVFHQAFGAVGGASEATGKDGHGRVSALGEKKAPGGQEREL